MAIPLDTQAARLAEGFCPICEVELTRCGRDTDMDGDCPAHPGGCGATCSCCHVTWTLSKGDWGPVVSGHAADSWGVPRACLKAHGGTFTFPEGRKAVLSVRAVHIIAVQGEQ